MTQQPEFSVILTARNRSRYLGEALRALQLQDLAPGRYEVIVVDNASTDDTREVVDEISRRSEVRIRYVHESRIGLHYARHRGALEAAGEVLVYTEDDVIVPGSWLAAAAACMADPSVAAVAGGLVGKWEVPEPEWLDAVGTDFLGLLDLGSGTFDLPESAYLCGGNFAIRREVLFAIGGFNPDLLPEEQLHLRGDGEVGLLIKLRQQRFRVLYCSAFSVEHVVPASKVSLEYVHRRYRKEGVSRMFTVCRQRKGNRAFILADVLLTAGRLAVNTGGMVLTRRGGGAFSKAVFQTYLRARMRHGLRLLMNAELRQYTLSESFMCADCEASAGVQQ